LGNLWEHLVETGSTQLELKSPHEEWLVAPFEFWNWWYHTDHSGSPTVYKRDSYYPTTCTTSSTRCHCHFRPSGPALIIPSEAIPISIEQIQDKIIIIGTPDPLRVHPPQTDKLITWQDHMNAPTDLWLLQNVTVAAHCSFFAESLRQGNIIVVSDGSEKAKLGSEANALHSLTTGQRIKLTSLAAGNPQDQQSH